jgi:tetratricopeptide (TPR) repeat protein
MKAGQWDAAIQDCDSCLEMLQRWPVVAKPPAEPRNLRPPDAPTLDDHTFINPHEVREDSWLMKQQGVDEEALPDIPEGWEWKRDAAEKVENSWVAVKKTLTMGEVQIIRGNLMKLQDAVFTQDVSQIQEAITESKSLLAKNTGPSVKAIKQAEEFVTTLEKKLAVEEDIARARQARLDEEQRTPVSAAGLGFPAKHPLQRARRRLFCKVTLRRAKALEEEGDLDAAASAVRGVLRLEPKNDEALELLARVRPMSAAPEPEKAAVSAEAAVSTLAPASASSKPALEKAAKTAPVEDEEDEEDEDDNGGSVVGLVESGAKYIARQDYKGAMEVLAYAVKTAKWTGRPLTRLKCLSNLTLCLQKLRSSSELLSVADSAITEMNLLRGSAQADALPNEVVTQLQLNKMECAILSRRGWAHHQLQHFDLGDADARRVKELLALLGQ